MRFPYGHADWMRREFGADRSAWPYDPEKHVLAVDGNIWGHPDAGAIWFDVMMPFLGRKLNYFSYSSIRLSENRRAPKVNFLQLV